MNGTRFNHLGHCVTDIERSKRFYTELFGFVVERELDIPDDPTDKLLGLAGPLGLHCAYLRLGDEFVIELLSFRDAEVHRPSSARTMDEVGLTHISFSVPDVASTCEKVRDLGGEVLESTDIGFGVFVKDPDGQLIELLTMSYWEGVQAERGS